VHLRQLRALKAAYESSTPKEPFIPPADSPIPALLALRNTHETIEDTKTNLATTNSDLTATQERLEKEKADLSDAGLITRGLEDRVRSLQNNLQERTQKPPSQIGRDLMRDMKKKKAHYDTQTGRLVKSFNGFVDNHLAPMLAAEELGGPAVGGILDIDEMTLEAGFSTQGRAKKRKEAVDDKRQRRIDEIWGQKPQEDDENEEGWNERSAAAAEIRELTEQLLNKLVEEYAGGSGAYVELQRESAAARFLVRSKVAQFHPRDARRLRLIDFGRELDS